MGKKKWKYWDSRESRVPWKSFCLSFWALVPYICQLWTRGWVIQRAGLDVVEKKKSIASDGSQQQLVAVQTVKQLPVNSLTIFLARPRQHAAVHFHLSQKFGHSCTYRPDRFSGRAEKYSESTSLMTLTDITKRTPPTYLQVDDIYVWGVTLRCLDLVSDWTILVSSVVQDLVLYTSVGTGRYLEASWNAMTHAQKPGFVFGETDESI